MKKLSVLLVLLICTLGFVSCKNAKDDIVHAGVNAVISEIDAEKNQITVTDLEAGRFSIETCVLDCAAASMIYCDYDTEEIREITIQDLQIGDSVILNVKDSELKNLQNGSNILKIDQLQLGAQRLN